MAPAGFCKFGGGGHAMAVSAQLCFFRSATQVVCIVY